MNLNGPDPTANRIFWILVIACLLAMRSAYPEPATPPKPPAYIATILRNAEIQHDLPIGLAVVSHGMNHHTNRPPLPVMSAGIDRVD